MKRYLVFAGEIFYPNGGMQDFKSDHDELSEASEVAEKYVIENPGFGNGAWSEVFDTETMKPYGRCGGYRLDECFEFPLPDEEAKCR